MDEAMERAQLLARFKLQVKRALGETVDLEALTRDPQYARQRLSEIEDAATDEDLLIMVLRLRDLLLPVPTASAQAPVVEAAPAPVAPAPAPAKETRSYLMGARAW